MAARKKIKASLIFEIEFFEKLLQGKKDFVDALIPLAEVYTLAGMYDKGLSADEKLAVLRPDNAEIFYNLACSYALTGKIPESFSALTKAIDLGYDDFKHMDMDPDLSSLRNDQRYKKIIDRVLRKKGVKNGMGETVG